MQGKNTPINVPEKKKTKPNNNVKLVETITEHFNLPIRADGAGGLASGSVAAGIVFE